MPFAIRPPAIIALLVSLLTLGAPTSGAGAAEAESPYWGLLTFPYRAATDLPDFVKAIDPRDHYQGELGITALTLGLYYEDQKIIDGSQRFARHVHLISKHDDGRQTDQ